MIPLTLSIALSLLLFGSGHNPAPSFSRNAVRSPVQQAGKHPRLSLFIAQVTYKTYSNARFNYSISYPAGLLIPQGEAENGDGQIFRSRDGRAEMRVFGRYNVQNETLQSAYNSAQEGKQVTYKVLKGSFYVVSGKQNGKIFYEKTILKGDTFKTFMIEYDEAERATYDSVIARIVRSFVG
jgi:hypothetical protein